MQGGIKFSNIEISFFLICAIEIDSDGLLTLQYIYFLFCLFLSLCIDTFCNIPLQVKAD